MDRQLARPSQFPWFEPWSTYTTREYLYYPRVPILPERTPSRSSNRV
jgi:hypothetical protein